MLALTDNAVDAVKKIVSSTEEDGAGGIRVMAEQDGAETRFLLSVAAVPSEDDEVVEDHGARVFLEPNAAALLDGKVLDARIDHDQVAFKIGDQI